jgi:hypothetical protein
MMSVILLIFSEVRVSNPAAQHGTNLMFCMDGLAAVKRSIFSGVTTGLQFLSSGLRRRGLNLGSKNVTEFPILSAISFDRSGGLP